MAADLDHWPGGSKDCNSVTRLGGNTVIPRLSLAALVFVQMAGSASAKVQCEEFKTKVNKILQEEGNIPLKWAAASSFKGFNSINPLAGIKAAITCNDAEALVELSASVSLDDADTTAEPIFVRGMLSAIDPKMTRDRAEDLAQKARARLSMRKPPASYDFRVAEYKVVFEKARNGSGGVRFRYEIETRK